MLLICEKRSAKNRRFMAGIVELSTDPKTQKPAPALQSLEIHVLWH